jgi:flagellar protein FlbB
MKVSRLVILFLCVFIWLFLPCSITFNSGAADGNTEAPKTQYPPSVISDAKRATETPTPAEKSQELVEKEAALKIKEQELKRMSNVLDARIKELDAARKALEGSMAAKKKLENEQFKKMLKLYKSLRPAEAAKLLDKLDEDIAFEMLNQMNQRTTVKIIPFMNQARVLKWTKLALKGK